SFGGLMMAAAAFTQAQSSLRWFVDNFSIIADWRATLLRVAALRQALQSDLETKRGGSRIDRAEGEPGRLAIEALRVRSWAGRDLDRLVPLLDVTRRWERELNIDELLLLGFARVVLQQPPWLLMDEAFGALDGTALERIAALFTGPLARMGVIHIGSAGQAQ